MMEEVPPEQEQNRPQRYRQKALLRFRLADPTAFFCRAAGLSWLAILYAPNLLFVPNPPKSLT